MPKLLLTRPLQYMDPAASTAAIAPGTTPRHLPSPRNSSPSSPPSIAPARYGVAPTSSYSPTMTELNAATAEPSRTTRMRRTFSA